MDCIDLSVFYVFFFKQKTAYEVRISDWSSDVCSSDLLVERVERRIVFVEQCGQPRLSGGKIGCRLRAGRGEGEGQRSRRPEPVLRHHTLPLMFASDLDRLARHRHRGFLDVQIGRASWRERVCE